MMHGPIYMICLKHFWFWENWARCHHKCTQVFRFITRYSCKILMKLGFARQIFERNLKYTTFMKIRPTGAKLFHADGQTHDEASSRSSQFSQGAIKTSLLSGITPLTSRWVQACLFKRENYQDASPSIWWKYRQVHNFRLLNTFRGHNEQFRGGVTNRSHC